MIDLDHWSLVLLRNCESLSHQSLNHMHWHATNQSTDSVSIPRSISLLPLSSKPLWIVPSFSFNTTWHFLALQIDSQLQGQAPQGPPKKPDPPKDTFCSSVRSSRFGFFFLLLFLAQRACRGASAVCQNMLSVGGQIWKNHGINMDQWLGLKSENPSTTLRPPTAKPNTSPHSVAMRQGSDLVFVQQGSFTVPFSMYWNLLVLSREWGNDP